MELLLAEHSGVPDEHQVKRLSNALFAVIYWFFTQVSQLSLLVNKLLASLDLWVAIVNNQFVYDAANATIEYVLKLLNALLWVVSNSMYASTLGE